jgi:hypothetical protein
MMQCIGHGAKNLLWPKICLGIGTQKPAKNLAHTKIFYRQKLLGFNIKLTKKY